VAVSREHRRPKTDRLDTEQLKRAFLGWLRGERDHCKMAAIPTLAQEDAKRPHRERDTLVAEQTSIVNRMKGAGAAWHPHLQSEAQEGTWAPGAGAHTRGRAESAFCRDGRVGAPGAAGRLRQADRRGNRKVGEGNPDRWNKGGVICFLAAPLVRKPHRRGSTGQRTECCRPTDALDGRNTRRDVIHVGQHVYGAIFVADMPSADTTERSDHRGDSASSQSR
jgi:hypothetical protein